MSEFLHGLEFLPAETTSPVQLRRSSIIGLVGTATKGPINTPTIVISEADGYAKFGRNLTQTIPQALEAIFKQGKEVGYIVVVRVRPDIEDVNDEHGDFGEGNTVTLAHKPLVPGSVAVRSGDDGRPYVEHVDYVVDYEEGILARVAGHIMDNEILTTYSYYSDDIVNDSDIIGTDTDGKRTGIQALKDAESLTNYKPKILIAPMYSKTKAVFDALVAMAVDLKGKALADLEEGSTKEEAVTFAQDYKTYGGRPIICYPNALTDAKPGTRPISPYVAGVISRVMNQYGYWYSPSNHPIYGIDGLETPIDFIYDSQQCTASYLNENGIITIIKRDGQYYVWGNRTLSTDADFKFISVQSQHDAHVEALIQYILTMLDKPINKAWFENVEDSINAFLNREISAGAIVYGKFKFLADENPPENIRQGIVTANWDWTPTYPAEHIIIKESINIDALASLFS